MRSSLSWYCLRPTLAVQFNFHVVQWSSLLQQHSLTCTTYHSFLSPHVYLTYHSFLSPLLQTELKHFVANMWEKELLTNVTDGLAYLDSIDDGDGAFNVAQIEAMQKRYPIVMYPLYRLQVYVLFCHCVNDVFVVLVFVATNFPCFLVKVCVHVISLILHYALHYTALHHRCVSSSTRWASTGGSATRPR